MSIAIGVFDFFSYAIPGSLYLLLAVYLLAVLQIISVNPQNIELSGELIVVWGIAGYVVGLILDSVARIIWYRLLGENKIRVKALEEFESRESQVKVRFTADDWPVLLAYIKHNSPENVLIIEKDKAVSIMLRNISLCCFLFSVIQVVVLLRNGFSFFQLGLGIAAIVFSILSAILSFRFNKWFFLAIYESAVSLGPEMSDLIGQKDSKETYRSIMLVTRPRRRKF